MEENLVRHIPNIPYVMKDSSQDTFSVVKQLNLIKSDPKSKKNIVTRCYISSLSHLRTFQFSSVLWSRVNPIFLYLDLDRFDSLTCCPVRQRRFRSALCDLSQPDDPKLISSIVYYDII